MRLLKAVLFLVLIALQFHLKSQSVYPVEYFQSPMDTPLYLSAPFGSLRDNHFHSGMDIRTYEKEGLPVYAVADGYVARIKYATNGYGKAIYINHPNGYTSVYGHLQKAEGELASYIKRYQYEIERFDFDHFPGSGKLKVSKGQIIGWSGNSGGSTGPHLHFEIRDTRTEEVINPQLFGIRGVDQFAPVIKKIVLYSLSQNRPVVTTMLELNWLRMYLAPDSILTVSDTLKQVNGPMGIAAEAYDYLTNTTTEYSIYGLEVMMDGKKIYAYKLDRFAFDDSRSINVHIDYALYKESKIRYQKCFKDDGNRIGIYNYLRNKGKILLPKDTILHTVMITASDVNGRNTRVRFYLKYDSTVKVVVAKTPPANVAIFYPQKNNSYKTKECEVLIPAKALYDTLLFTYKLLPKEKGSYSATHQIQDLYTPLNSSMSVSVKPEATAELVKDKLLLASLNTNGTLSAIGGGYENGWVTARTSTFATVLVVADSVPPVVKLINVSKDGEVKDTAGWTFRIEDNLSGIASCRMTINGKWILTDYDAKNDAITYLFDDNTTFNKKQEVSITVVDKKGNSTVLKREITFIKY